MSTDAYLTALRLALNQRTGRSWQTRRGRGTSIDRVYVTSPPERKRPELGTMMSRADRTALAEALIIPVDTITDMAVIMPEQREQALRNVQQE
jgi:hypothetical protein